MTASLQVYAPSFGTAGDDTGENAVVASNETESEFLYGYGGDDELLGNAGTEILIGDAGYDTLERRDGYDAA